MIAKKARIRLLIAFIFLTIILLILGSFYVKYSWEKSERESSEQALLIATTSEIALNGEMVKQLNADQSDEEMVAYQSVKERLMELTKVSPDINFTYIYKLKEGKLYFVADSEPPESEDYSPPGQEYSEASEEYWKPFTTGEATITPPVTDRWGTWISVLVPMHDQQTGEIFAVFAMDYPAERWGEIALLRVEQAGLEVGGVFLLLLAFYLLIVRNRKLIARKDLFRSLIKSMDDLVFVMDDKFIFKEYYQPSKGKLLIKPEQFIGKSLDEIGFPDPARGKIKKILKRVLASGKGDKVEYYLDMEKKRLWFELSVNIFQDDQHEFLGLVAVARDITARKKIEEDIKNTLTQYQSLVDNIQGIVYRCRFDKDWTMLYVSSDVDEISGYRSSDFINNKVRTYESIIHRADTAYVNKIISDAVKVKKPWDIEYRIIDKHGVVKWVHELGRGVFDEQGTVKYLDGLIINITDRKIIEEKLQKSETRISTIVQGIGDGVFVVDKNLRIILFNAKASEISGFSPAEALNRPYKEILHFVYERDKKLNDKFIKQAFATGQVQTMTNHTLLYRKNKTTVPVADSAAPLKNKDGEIFGCVVVFRDVTKEREVDKMKSEFIAIASHQLKTPLAAIKWMCELMFGDKVNPLSNEQLEYLRDIYMSNERMLKLVDDLLNISHIETGRKFSINKKKTDIVKIVNEVLKENQKLCKEKKIKIIKCEGAPEKLIMQIDREKIKQVVANLINNALKYSKAGGIVEIGCEAGKGKKIFKIKDGGIGIPRKQQSKVFERFFRADNAATTETDGTGLGLYIAKAIVEAHGGKIWFESEENKGTTFYFSLPI